MSDAIAKQYAIDLANRIHSGKEQGISDKTRESLINSITQELGKNIKEFLQTKHESGATGSVSLFAQFSGKLGTPGNKVLGVALEAGARTDWSKFERALEEDGLNTEEIKQLRDIYTKSIERGVENFLGSVNSFV